MVVALSRMTLAEFLSLPDIEASPAWELINLEVVQNPLPTVFHSRLQKCLLTTIDRPAQAYEALPELRCVLLESSVLPDLSVMRRERLPQFNQPIEETG
jgi:Uma2 family endonuclease